MHLNTLEIFFFFFSLQMTVGVFLRAAAAALAEIRAVLARDVITRYGTNQL